MGEFIEALTGCPCKNCICVPICHNRRFTELLYRCRLAGDYLYDTEYFSMAHRRAFFPERLQSMEEILHPDKWDLSSFSFALIKT